MSDPARERYRHLRFLVIDDQPAARDGLRTCAQTMGAFSVEFCTAFKDAIARVRRAVPDVILCDYNLGERRNGQHLLEEMRRDQLLPEESVFIMVTAEKSYENVVATVELGPDDYIIKPFSPDRLRFRLDRALTRKQFFKPLYVAKREGDYATAEAFIAQHLASEEGKPYRFDLMRALAELRLGRGDPQAAQAAYAEILELHPFPWARAGLARALLMQNRLQEARELVDGVVVEAPMYFDAFDLKARICMEMGDHAEAQRTVEDASRRSIKNHARKRLLADVALRNGDAETARRAIAEVLEIDVLGDPPSIADRLMLVRSHLEAGDSLAAEQALQAIQTLELETASLDDKTSHLALRARLDQGDARAAFAARRASLVSTEIGLDASVDSALTALLLQDRETACALTGRLFEQGSIRPVFAQLRSAFAAGGLEHEFREMQKLAALSRIGIAGARAPEAPQAG
ncbi:MAG: response regulator [Zoogloeaceae bacterium]|mgnify:CR=1 FL=1|nr:response regulator [Zoogloeaceae bacterium]